MMTHVLAILIALMLDRLFGDPARIHPVRWIGTLIAFCDQRLNRGRRKKEKGMLTVLFVAFLSFFISFSVISVSYHVATWLGVFVEGVVIFTTIAAKSLKEAAYDVLSPLERGDLSLAREKLSMIVGRDTERLNEQEIVRACVETVAENTSDGVTAPLFYAFLGGGALSMLYRAVNTCDSMLGHKNERYRQFGWASARLDDVLNYIPARLTALVMISIHAHGRARIEAFRLLFRDARKHPSPNSGWGEAAMAALLRIQLGGINTYQGVISVRPTIGEAREPLKKEHIRQAVAVMERTVTAFTIGGIVIAMACAWSQSASFI
jgi:adenosylcobinamide-phosphate synthase